MKKLYVQYWVFVKETVYHKYTDREQATKRRDYLNSICEFTGDKAEVVKVVFDK